MKKCKVKNCQNKYREAGYCGKHYLQIWKYGKIIERTNRDKNKIVDCENYCEILLYNEKQEIIAKAKIDIEDKEKIKNYKWYLTSHKYVRCQKFYLHNFLSNTPKGLHTDHISGDKLDNRKNNLRICTASQNVMNSFIRKNNKSGYSGIYLRNDGNKWVAQITVNNKTLYLGSYRKKENAIKIRDKFAKKYFGNFAKINVL